MYIWLVANARGMQTFTFKHFSRAARSLLWLYTHCRSMLRCPAPSGWIAGGRATAGRAGQWVGPPGSPQPPEHGPIGPSRIRAYCTGCTGGIAPIAHNMLLSRRTCFPATMRHETEQPVDWAGTAPVSRACNLEATCSHGRRRRVGTVLRSHRGAASWQKSCYSASESFSMW